MIIVGEPVGPAWRLERMIRMVILVLIYELKGSPVVDLVSRYGSWLVSGAGVVPVYNENEPIFSPGIRIKHTAEKSQPLLISFQT